MTTIERYVFWHCYGLEKVCLPGTLTSFSTDAFTGCSSIKDATAPTDRIWKMCDFFPDAYATALRRAAVAKGTPSVVASAFAGCSKLESVTIPDSVTSVGALAFKDCAVLGSVALPAGVASVAADAFRGCSSLAAITVADGCEAYRSEDGVLYAVSGSAVSLVCCPQGVAGAYEMPDDVTGLGAYAFENCGKITSLSVPEGVTALPLTAFAGTTAMTDIDVADDNPAFKSIDGVVFSKDGKTLVFCPRGRRGNYAIPDGVTTIADNAFAGCIHLTGVAFPASIRKIGTSAFEGCSALSNVDLNEKLDEIGSYAFRNCVSLTSLTVPDNVVKLGRGAFEGCTALTNLVLPEGLQLEPETLSGTISGIRTLNRGVVYHVTGNITISSGATLNIPSGVILKMASGVSITVNSGGTLNAQGTRSAPVIFTSIKDDSVGGDTNGDGSATHADKGDWGKIGINGGMATFNYSKILYSSRNQTTGAINMNGGKVVFSNGEIAHCQYDAVGVESGNFYMTNSVIRDCLLAFRHWARDPIVNCIIYDCGRLTQGGGQHFYNCIFSRITETWEAFGFPQNGTTYDNCCFWNEEGSVLTKEGTQDALTVCGKNGNIWADPKFEDAEKGDYRIKADSPCVDAGDGSVAPATDYFGQTRQNIYEDATGTPDANGNYPDIGIHEVMPRIVTNDVDLPLWQ